MTKVLLLSNLYPSQKSPTRGVFNQHVFGAIAEHCEVRVVSPLPWWTRWENPDEWFFAPREDFTGLSVRLPTYWSLPGLHKFHASGMYYSLVYSLARLRREFPFEAILASWLYPDAAAAAHLARHFHCPLVTNVLGSDINALITYPPLLSQITETLKASTRIISVSGALKERIIELGVPEEKIAVQHNGVDQTEFDVRDREAASQLLGIPSSGRRILYVGNFVPEKGVDVLVEAFVKLAGDQKDLFLSLVGSGSLEARLRERVVSAGIENQVTFHGRRPHSEIPYWMNAATLFCLPSLREGCPNVILEALASGTPVAASNVGGVPEILDSTQGELAEAGNAEALALCLDQALRRTWSPEKLRHSVQHRSWTEVGSHYYRMISVAIDEFHGTKPLAFPI